jgi:hypothetical protein
MRKRCNRKVWSKVNPISYAIEGAAITPRAELDKIMAVELTALDAFTRGQARMQEWYDLAALNNITQTMAGQGIGREALESAHRAETALIEAAERFQRTGRMGLSGEGIKALRDVIEYHDLQRSSISRGEYEKALVLTANRIRSGYATIDLKATIGKPREAA